jgi:hypothetical protein
LPRCSGTCRRGIRSKKIASRTWENSGDSAVG